MDECPFCESSSPPLENDHAYVRPDKYPVSKGHLLICPRRRFSDFFDATPEERSAMLSLLDEAKAMSMESLAPAGFNVGINFSASEWGAISPKRPVSCRGLLRGTPN
jgi:diadenosine tetraphosphate (Ap4A) HIT family hydrolase